MVFLTIKVATLDTNLCHTVPTTIGRIPPPGLSKGVRGALTIKPSSTLGYFPSRSKLATIVMEHYMLSVIVVATPLSLSTRCCALRLLLLLLIEEQTNEEFNYYYCNTPIFSRYVSPIYLIIH